MALRRSTVSRVLVFLTFVLHGLVFIRPPDAARQRMKAGPLSLQQFRMLGFAEVLGGAAVLRPEFDRRFRTLGWLARGGLLGVTVPATVLHIRKREPVSAALTVSLSVLIYSTISD